VWIIYNCVISTKNVKLLSQQTERKKMTVKIPLFKSTKLLHAYLQTSHLHIHHITRHEHPLKKSRALWPHFVIFTFVFNVSFRLYCLTQFPHKALFLLLNPVPFLFRLFLILDTLCLDEGERWMEAK
jgi:hypothetical protein